MLTSWLINQSEIVPRLTFIKIGTTAISIWKLSQQYASQQFKFPKEKPCPFIFLRVAIEGWGWKRGTSNFDGHNGSAGGVYEESSRGRLNGVEIGLCREIVDKFEREVRRREVYRRNRVVYERKSDLKWVFE